MDNNIMKYETDNGKITLSPSIVKKYLVSGQAERVTEQEVVMFMQMCKYQNLNPFLREAYLIKFGNAPATMVTGKDTFVKRACKSPLCVGYEAGVIVQKGDTIEYRKGALVLPSETLVGGWGKVYRKDWKIPLENTVGLDEYQRRTNSGKLMSTWAKMPATMIRKVALVQALREAFPEEFSGLYSPEEMPVDDNKLDETPVEAVVVDENVASDEQLAEMYDLAKEKNVKGNLIKEYMKANFDKESSTKLTGEEANKVIKMLKNTCYDEKRELTKDFKETCDDIEEENGGAEVETYNNESSKVNGENGEEETVEAVEENKVDDEADDEIFEDTPFEENNLVTDKQRKMLWALAKEKGFEEQMPGYIEKTYEADSSKKLTKSQASEIIQTLQEII